jgi:CelD/BcsL family acetyltransferase involved in cellulose biosynthesis
MRARFYGESDASAWDHFCAESYGATFLHKRHFLSYHGTRFADRSIVLEEGGRWVGVIPAARSPDRDDTVVSHPGSSYGGVVHRGHLRGEPMIEAFVEVRRLLSTEGTRYLQYKAVPSIYHRAPAQDDLYALHRLGARRYRCDLSTCIDLQSPLPVAARRRRALRKSERAGVTIVDGRVHAPNLWLVLEDNLMRKHGVRPTHSIEDIMLLADRFPKEIEFVVAKSDGDVVAGVTLFRGGPAVHAQYIASSELGYELSALDAVFDHCIRRAAEQGSRYFDFGISTESQGFVLNESLYRFKSEFGGSGVVHEFYELSLAGS